MAATRLEGGPIAEGIKAALGADIAALKQAGKTPHLAAVQVGENPASAVYVRSQKRNCEEAGIEYQLHELPAETTQAELIAFLEGLNADPAVTGVILQMPLPKAIDTREAQSRIAPAKDVEGVTPFNMGWVVPGLPRLAPCTALSVVELVRAAGVDLRGREAVIVGASEIVGKTVALLLAKDQDGEQATVTVCNMYTRDLESHVRRADILVVAVGKPGLIPGAWVKEGAVVVDVGINRVPALDEQGQPIVDDQGKKKMKTVGDVEFEPAAARAGWISPVPGGVGPLTVAMLLRNTILAAQRQEAG
jgi:methylenetetrahydrofolate dehydrogenase (NADP+)/methenyltetrahydrofolate cyclohydrolase